MNRACCSAEERSKHFTQPAGCAFLNEHDVLAHMHSVRCSTVIRVIAMPLLLPPLLLLLPPPPPPPPCCRTNRTTTTDTCIVNFSVIDRMRAHFLSNVIAEFLFHSQAVPPLVLQQISCVRSKLLSISRENEWQIRVVCSSGTPPTSANHPP